MNTKQLNLTEMSPREMKETEGGILPLLALGAVLLLTGCMPGCGTTKEVIKRTPKKSGG